ncbi:MAG TPA: VanW family protein [Solirubrobacteraceae bacterium]|nr:VanW family protein [Solirubrobacteraceae bacterium]
MQWPGKKGVARRAIAAAAALVVVLAGASLTLGAVYSGRVLPNTTVAGIELGGASAEEARSRLAAALSPDRRLRVVGAGRELLVTAGEAGYRADVEATLQRALAAGRDDGAGGLAGRLLWLVGPGRVPVAADLDRVAFERMVSAVVRAGSRPAFRGGLRVDRRTLEVTPVAPRDGVRVDRDALGRRLRRALAVATQRQVTAPVVEDPAPPRAAVEDVADRARSYLRTAVRVGSGRVTIPPRRVAAALTVAATRDGRSASLATTRRGRARLAELVARRVDRPPREARIAAPARTALFESKEDASWRPRPAAVSVRPSLVGRQVQRRRLAARLDAAVRRGRHRVALAVRRLRPRLEGRALRRARFLIGTFTTRYAPGEPRVRNIQRIARAVDGTIVQPGSSFSINRISGPRTRAKGYVKAPFIADDKIVPSVGGGVSQFATTMYNAAYFAGLRLDAHQPHSLYIDRYPPGREATLNYPDIDVVWANDTEVPVFVRAVADATSVTVSLYGDNGGRRVRAEAGARRPVPGGTFEITVTRVIRYPEGRTERRPVTTRYSRPRED